MKMRKKQFLAVVTAAAVLCGCSQKSESVIPEPMEAKTESRSNYIQMIRDQILQLIITDGMSDYEKIKAIHRYIVETSNWEEPMAYDSWIIRGGRESKRFDISRT